MPKPFPTQRLQQATGIDFGAVLSPILLLPALLSAQSSSPALRRDQAVPHVEDADVGVTLQIPLPFLVVVLDHSWRTGGHSSEGSALQGHSRAPCAPTAPTYDLLHHLIHGLFLLLHLAPAIAEVQQDAPKGYQT